MTDAQVAGGHKATINNPNASDEAKENSRQVLENEFNGGDGKTSKYQYSHWKCYSNVFQLKALATTGRRILVTLLAVSRREFLDPLRLVIY
jgi:hypothetical protein